MKLLVPLDGSELAEAALPLADDLARRMDAEIVLVAVSELPETTAQADQANRDLEAMLAGAARRVSRPPQLRVEPAGDPVRGILEACEDEGADLVVMSTHGRSWLGELTDGSIATELLRRGHVPVTLVRPDL